MGAWWRTTWVANLEHFGCILALVLISSCGPQKDISRPTIAHKSLDVERNTEMKLQGQSLPKTYVHDLLAQEIHNDPPTLINKTLTVNLISEAITIDKSDDAENFLICDEQMILPAGELESFDMQQVVAGVKEAAAVSGIDLTFHHGDSGQGMAIFLSNNPNFSGCLVNDIQPLGLVTFDPYDLVKEDRAIINTAALQTQDQLIDAIGLSLSMMTGHTLEDQVSLDQSPFENAPDTGHVFGSETLLALNAALRQISPEDVVDIKHLDSEIKTYFSPGLEGLPGMDKILTLITMAGSSANGNKIDTQKASQVLVDGFVNNSGSLATVATLAGHPEVAVAIKLAAALLGGKVNQQDEAPAPEPTRAYLPDLADFLGNQSVDMEGLLLDYRATHKFIKENYPQGLAPLRSLLKLAVAQKAQALSAQHSSIDGQ